ncbi:MAG TPA: methyltransferase domain-containing protein [Euzebyales bacterium]|nr:methyltransferase domain-containing protein [Euzebyales bacterium]
MPTSARVHERVDAAGRMTRPAPSSGSLVNATYWWYVARADLLEVALGASVPDGGVVVDIGSADGPSVGWLGARARRIPLDIDPAVLPRGGVCASAMALPFADGVLDAVSAFDVIEHFQAESALLAELHRVVRPGGRLLLSVPAYRWAWSSHDVAAGHHRRYTRRRLVAALTAAGFAPARVTHAFASTFPFFAADRLRERLFDRPVQRVAVDALPSSVERMLVRCTKVDAWLLRFGDLPFGSSILATAVRH